MAALADQHFVDRLQQQEENAVAELVDRYYEPIYRYIYQFLYDAETAADLTQDTFLNAYKALPRLNDDSNLSAWLFTIATNLIRKHRRRRNLIQWIPLQSFHGYTEGPAKRIAEQDLVTRVLEQLPEEYKTCLLLQIWGGLSCAEIGQVVDKTEAAVKMTLVRARRRFRRIHVQLASEGSDEPNDPGL